MFALLNKEVLLTETCCTGMLLCVDIGCYELHGELELFSDGNLMLSGTAWNRFVKLAERDTGSGHLVWLAGK